MAAIPHRKTHTSITNQETQEDTNDESEPQKKTQGKQVRINISMKFI